ncbi:MAG: phosphoglucosamine mutase [Corynebacteriales bacterium]|nr:phosphoglucosamine mutase [Mycobacteriales bacterium]
MGSAVTPPPSRLFGTDGVRGLANDELTPELALRVAAAAVRVLPSRGERPIAVVGRDPRASGEMLEAAVCAGLASAGADVLRLGVLPTPAVAYLTAELGADLGVMLSASHNPMPDNGIKIFAAGGHKLPDSAEDDIALQLDAQAPRPTGAAVGRIRDLADGGSRYIEHLLSTVSDRLDGIRLVVDCAHGAASAVAPELYRRAGAEVIVIAAEPDGLNINDGVGSTHLDVLRAAVREHGADLGIAHDGDADRCLAVDAAGEIVDGDQLMAVLAIAMKDAGTLTEDTLVATVMSNLGLHLAMREQGINVLTTAVGDRYVLQLLRERKLALGGEQSGHVVFPAFATTGDGLLTALQVLSRMASTGKSLAELVGVMQRLPQVLINVRVSDKRVAQAENVQKAVAAAEAELGQTGRVLLRSSGTEPLVRVMVEAPTADQAQLIADQLSTVVRDHH